MEKIFVLVPVYNVEQYLERCINSILNQTYTNWELVLVNDGSTDGSGAICDRYAAEHDNITVIHQDNCGVSAARNTAVEYALNHGDHEQDWINFIDSDDFVHPKYLEYLYRAAKEAGTEISSCGFVRTEATEIDSKDIGELKFECLTPEEYWCNNYTRAVVPWGKLYRLFLFKDIVYPVGRIHEDAFVNHKILFQKAKIAVIGQRLYCWYCNPISITMSEWTPKRIDELDALDEQTVFFKNTYTRSYKLAVKILFKQSILCLCSIDGLSPKYDHMKKEFQHRQSRAFKLYSQEFGTMHAITFWFTVRIIKPVKRLLHQKSVLSFLKRKVKQKLLRHK